METLVGTTEAGRSDDGTFCTTGPSGIPSTYAPLVAAPPAGLATAYRHRQASFEMVTAYFFAESSD